MELSGKSCIRQNFGFSGSLLEIPGTPGGVLIFRDFPGKNGRVGQYGVSVCVRAPVRARECVCAHARERQTLLLLCVGVHARVCARARA